MAAEMDNPYTREGMATLKSALDQFEKRVRDVINFIEGQLARALASITPEQKAELEEAFKHFDKSQDGKLNQVEFSAAMTRWISRASRQSSRSTRIARARTPKASRRWPFHSILSSRLYCSSTRIRTQWTACSPPSARWRTARTRCLRACSIAACYSQPMRSFCGSGSARRPMAA